MCYGCGKSWAHTKIFLCIFWICPWENFVSLLIFSFNPLTPVPPITGHDEPWPFFHFWRHHFWPKLASSTGGKDLSSDAQNRVIGSREPDEICTKNAQNVEWKTQTKISCHYTWLLHGKNCLSRWRFLRCFLTVSKPGRRSITAAKRNEKVKKERRKKNIPKIEKPIDVGNFLVQKLSQNFDFCTCPSQNVLQRDTSGKKGKWACCKMHFSTRLKLFWPRSSLKTTKMSKKRIFAKSSRSQWVKPVKTITYIDGGM